MKILLKTTITTGAIGVLSGITQVLTDRVDSNLGKAAVTVAGSVAIIATTLAGMKWVLNSATQDEVL